MPPLSFGGGITPDSGIRMVELTIRQEIIALLKEGPKTAKDVSRALGIKEKDVIAHLPHVARSVGLGGRLAVENSECLKCGFQFKKRERLQTPSRCPVCKSERITETRYRIEED